MTIIAISDTHVGTSEADTPATLRFLHSIEQRAGDVTDLVLCGDILDFWRCDAMDMVLESSRFMSALINMADAGVNIHYIAGNHDYVMRKAKSSHKRIKFSTDLELKQDGCIWDFIHGWEFDRFMKHAYFDAFCYTNITRGDAIWKTYNMYLRFLQPIEGFLARIRGHFIQNDMKQMIRQHDKTELLKNQIPHGGDPLGSVDFPDGGLIFGHLHMPYLNAAERMANCGSWHKSHPIHNTYIEIDESMVHLRREFR